MAGSACCHVSCQLDQKLINRLVLHLKYTTLLRVYNVTIFGWSVNYFSTINTTAINGHLLEFRMYIT